MGGVVKRGVALAGKLVAMGLASMLVVLLTGAALVALSLGIALILHDFVLHGGSLPGLTAGTFFLVLLVLGSYGKMRRDDAWSTIYLRFWKGNRPPPSVVVTQSSVADTAAFLAEMQPPPAPERQNPA